MITEITFTVPNQTYLKFILVPTQDQFAYELMLISKLVQLELDWQQMVAFCRNWRGKIWVPE